MANHISVRMAWHNDGWNGHICRDPQSNTYCCGRFSYPGDLISQDRDIEWENSSKVKGIHCLKLDKIPPCAYSINAFGSEALKAYSDPPDWFRDGSKGISIDIPPATVCIWPYRGMYGDDVIREVGSKQKYDYDTRLQNAKEYFELLEENKSLLFYYANYSNPFSGEDNRRYVLIGIARLKNVGKIHYYTNVSEEYKKKYAGGFVWQMPITSNYPDEGMRIPYHLYRDRPDVLERLAVFPEVVGNFKYATGILTDDDALAIIEKFIEVARYLQEIYDTSENWEARIQWLFGLTAELWKARGPYPGLMNVLQYVEFPEGIEFLKTKIIKEDQEEARNIIRTFLEGQREDLPGIVINAKHKASIRRKWKLLEDDDKILLIETIPRFNISINQIENILSETSENNNITATIKEINENPYILCEQYVGDDYDDVISFYKIDHGVLPSPELGLENLSDKDSPERFRALCVDALRHTDVHSFLSSTIILNNIQNRLKHLPDWKVLQFKQKYFEVDEEFLSQYLVIRQHEDNIYVYLKEVWEDERLIENIIKDLAIRPNIALRKPVTVKYFEELLFDSNSPIANKNEKEYRKAISQQANICQILFNKPLCVVSGAAGTGKTTVIRSLLTSIEKVHGAGTSFLLLAPTGKAAQRIKEKTGRAASTIHSHLASKGWLNDNFTFKRKGGQKTKEFSTIIIDECSMIDLSLMASLFRSIDWDHVERLILVGDPNQLPPIGKGKVYSEIIGYLSENLPDSIEKLEINVRQMENRVIGKGTAILELAELFIQEKQENDQYLKNIKESMLKRVQEGGIIDNDLAVYYWNDTADLEKTIQEVVLKDLINETELDKNTDPHELWQAGSRRNNEYLDAGYLQVLSPYRNDTYGVDYLNTHFQMLFNSKNADNYILDGISLGDKVIQIRNRPKSDPVSAYNFNTKHSGKEEVYNGEIGFTFKHPFDKKLWRLQKFSVRFETRQDILYNYGIHKNDDGSIYFYEPVENNLELAYAISIHKAQGSEFERVYLILPKRESRLLSMELMYTGITRAKSHLTIFAQEDISCFTRLCEIEKSNLKRINSSIFIFEPLPDDVIFSTDSWYADGKKISTLSKYFVRSKSEMNIANILSLKEISFEYEKPLFADDGTMYLPDFTLTWQGKKYFWEHVGRLDDKDYRSHWETKEKWYNHHFPGQLIITYESDKQTLEIEKILNDILGVD